MCQSIPHQSLTVTIKAFTIKGLSLHQNIQCQKSVTPNVSTFTVTSCVNTFPVNHQSLPLHFTVHCHCTSLSTTCQPSVLTFSLSTLCQSILCLAVSKHSLPTMSLPTPKDSPSTVCHQLLPVSTQSMSTICHCLCQHVYCQPYINTFFVLLCQNIPCQPCIKTFTIQNIHLSLPVSTHYL